MEVRKKSRVPFLGSCPLVKSESLSEALVPWLADEHWESTRLSLPWAGITRVGHLTTGNSGSNSGSRVCGSAFYQLKSLLPPLSRAMPHLSLRLLSSLGTEFRVCMVENKMFFSMAVQLASKLLLNRILLFHADLQLTYHNQVLLKSQAYFYTSLVYSQYHNIWLRHTVHSWVFVCQINLKTTFLDGSECLTENLTLEQFWPCQSLGGGMTPYSLTVVLIMSRISLSIW